MLPAVPAAAVPEAVPAAPELAVVPEPPVEPAPLPLLAEVEPAPVSVLGVLELTEPGAVPDAVVVVDVVSLVVDVVVGVVEELVVVEPGVALEPVLLYDVLAPLLQPARAALASAMAAR